jgi:hypothetical protein
LRWGSPTATPPFEPLDLEEQKGSGLNAINLRCKVNYGKGLGRNDLGVFKISGIVLAILGLLFSVVLQLYDDGRQAFYQTTFLISLYSVISYSLS